MNSNNNNNNNLYVGGAKRMTSNHGGEWLKIELDLTDLERLQSPDHIRTWTRKKDGTEHRVITLVCAELREENKKEWKTHSLKIDTFKPDSSKRSMGRPDQARGDAIDRVKDMFAPESDDQIPF